MGRVSTNAVMLILNIVANKNEKQEEFIEVGIFFRDLRRVYDVG